MKNSTDELFRQKLEAIKQGDYALEMELQNRIEMEMRKKERDDFLGNIQL